MSRRAVCRAIGKAVELAPPLAHLVFGPRPVEWCKSSALSPEALRVSTMPWWCRVCKGFVKSNYCWILARVGSLVLMGGNQGAPRRGR